jgi:hypothetical protein
MKHLTNDQINSELERLKKEQEELECLKKEQEKKEQEQRRRLKQSLRSMSDRELAEYLRQEILPPRLSKSGNPVFGPKRRSPGEKEITRRKRARLAALRREARKHLVNMSTNQLLEMAVEMLEISKTDGLYEPQVSAVVKELTERHRPIQKATEELTQVRRFLLNENNVDDPPLELITGGKEG